MSGMFEVLRRLRERRAGYRMKGEGRRAGEGREGKQLGTMSGKELM